MRYGIIFITAAIISFAATPFAKKLAYKLKAIDVPKDERRIHNRPIPRMGGLAIYIAYTLCSIIFMGLNKHSLGIIIGSSIIVVGGILDDIKSLKPIQKLIFQIIAATVLMLFGIRVNSITVPFFTENSSMDIGYSGIILTYLWVVGITNAVNLIDGLDGLACGICLISSITLHIVSLMSGRYFPASLTIALAGACLGFLPYNFNPASIFMGDTGSQFLGFTLSAISIQGAIKSAAAVSVAVPILALGLPIYDTIFAMVRRKINNKPIMQADRGHLHHRLLDLGLTQKQVVLIMYAISAILGATAIVAMKISNRQSYALLIIVCAFIISCAIEFGIFERKI